MRNKLLIAACLSAIAHVAVAQTTGQDLQRRDPGMSWPKGLDPARADVFNHNVLRMEASCEAVYRLLSEPEAWPRWLVFARDARVETAGLPLKPGSRFFWTIFGMPTESTVFVAEPGRRFGYSNTPPGPPPLYAQSWLLTPDPEGCLVETEEVGVGAMASEATRSGDIRVHVAHDLWLASLRWAVLSNGRSDEHALGLQPGR